MWQRVYGHEEGGVLFAGVYAGGKLRTACRGTADRPTRAVSSTEGRDQRETAGLAYAQRQVGRLLTLPFAASQARPGVGPPRVHAIAVKGVWHSRCSFEIFIINSDILR